MEETRNHTEEAVDTEAMEIVASNMRARRKELKLSRQTVADRMGLNQSTIYLYEKAEREIPLSRLKPLALALEEPNWIRLLQPDFGAQSDSGQPPQVKPAPALPVAQVPAPSQLTAEEREKWALFNRFLEFERGAAGGEDCLRFLNEAITTPLSRLFIEQAEGRIVRARERKPA